MKRRRRPLTARSESTPPPTIVHETVPVAEALICQGLPALGTQLINLGTVVYISGCPSTEARADLFRIGFGPSGNDDAECVTSGEA